MNTLKTIKFTLTFSVLLLLAACAQTSTQLAGQPEASSANPTEAIAELEDQIAAARQAELPVLSPQWFAKADAACSEAKKGVESGAELSKIYANINNGQDALSKARESAKVARTMLPAVIESRKKAFAAGAQKLGEPFESAENQFLRLTRAIEDNQIGYTKKHAAKVSETYLTLELLAIKDGTIETVRPVLEQAEKDKAEKFAPKSLSLAWDYFNETDAFISENRYAEADIDQKVQQALFMAQRAATINNQSKILAHMEPEDIALWMEDSLHQVTKKMSAPDVRNQPTEAQVKEILKSIQSLQDENRRLDQALLDQKNDFQKKTALFESNIAILKQQIAMLEGKAEKDQKVKEVLLAEQRAVERKLAAEREFNKKFLEVQALFRASEAEVYKQRNQLVIRLKAMRFPIGSAIIMPENFSLLTKVQEAIQLFNRPSVVVEGHTDSTGEEEKNLALSNERAKAVRDYLVANKTIPADKIYHKGYGSARPLASNATPEGRAINRRIDVVINPPPMPE